MHKDKIITAESHEAVNAERHDMEIAKQQHLKDQNIVEEGDKMLQQTPVEPKEGNFEAERVMHELNEFKERNAKLMQENAAAKAKIAAVERLYKSKEQAVALAQAAQGTAEHAACNAQQEMHNYADKIECQKLENQ